MVLSEALTVCILFLFSFVLVITVVEFEVTAVPNKAIPNKALYLIRP